MKLMQRGGRLADVVRQGEDVLFLHAVDEEVFLVRLKADFHPRQHHHALFPARAAGGAIAFQKSFARRARVALARQVWSVMTTAP